jgi:hypothetical protein
MKTLKYIAITALVVLMAHQVSGQQKKIWISGAARAIIYGDDYNTSNENDSTTARRLQSGHAMVDLGVNIQPNEQLLIQGMVRIRNDYGGFWGSGVSFDVRQLYIKGILGGFLRYQLGDINYRLSPYTFTNNVGLINEFDGVITSIPLQQIQYDLFYFPDHTWRQQGGALDFALEFSKIIDELQFELFTSRISGNEDSVNTTLYSGGSIVLVQSDMLKLGGQYVNYYDLKGTSFNDVILRNPVFTGMAEFNYKLKNTHLSAAVETGRSLLEWQNDTLAPSLEDYFYDATLKAAWTRIGLSVSAGYRDVGPNFRSAGAQTMQINFAATPQAYNRYGNAQELRQLSMLDLYRDASLYNVQIAPGLMAYDPRYDNATPYGRATPNRRGFTVEINYEDPAERWMVNATSELLTDAVGQGTSGLKNYNTTSIFARLNINNLVGWEERKLWLSGRVGAQNTMRSQTDIPKDQVDLATNFIDLNLTTTIIGQLELIAQYRLWTTQGNDLIALRNAYSEIINYERYRIDYNESLLGAGLQYAFSDKTHLRFMYQTFNWEDNFYGSTTVESGDQLTLPYTINTYTIFFTMNF